ncbi:MAG: type II secretion system GspH family protein [Ramlibacter sp.]|nr:type II secretion system GspH family protein [Ramlibacter sp.]
MIVDGPLRRDIRVRPRTGGFTLVELLVTLAIMGILATVTVPLAQISAQRQKERELRAALAQIRDAIDAYKRAGEQGRILVKLGESGYPRTLDELWQGVSDQRSPDRRKIYFLRAIPRDPMHEDYSVSSVESWGLRSYSSPPDDPSPGEDVYDVYSKSAKTGLDSLPYRQW